MKSLNTVSILLLAASLSSRASSTVINSRQSDNGYCNQLMTICAASPNAISNPWSVKACIFGATCFGGQRPVDGFLSALAGRKNVPAPASANVPRVSQATFNTISTNGQIVSQQNYIDGVFGVLSTTNGPFPDASFVINNFQRVAVWTAFCTGPGVPYKNFADYYQFSATVNSDGCPTGRPSGIGIEETCNKMFNTCVAQANSDVSDAWSHLACVLTATCAVGTVAENLEVVFVSKTGGLPETSLQKIQPRISSNMMNSISKDGKTISLQNYIDAYYGLLSKLGGPFPTTVDIVIAHFSRLQSWTAFPTGGIPFKNFADFLQYSAVRLPDEDW